MGASYEWLPGLMDSSDKSSKGRWEEAWGGRLSYGPGGGLDAILKGIDEGRINALISLGENPIGHFPVGSRVREILSKLDLIISIDMFQNDLSDMAHFVLPVASAYERSGHLVSAEGFVQPIKPTMAYWGESLPDWQILDRISTAMGNPMGIESAEGVMAEIVRFLPDLSPSSRNGSHFVGGTGEIHLATPVVFPGILSSPKSIQAGTALPAAHKANRESVSSRYLGWREKAKEKSGIPAHPIAGEGEFVLELTKSLFHSGKMTLIDSNLKKIQPEGKLRINRQTARKRKIKKGEQVVLRTTFGTCSFVVEPSPAVSEFELTFPVHFANGQVLGLFAPDLEFSAGTGSPVTHRIRVSLETQNAN